MENKPLQKSLTINNEATKQSASKNFSILVFVRVRPLLMSEFGKEIAVSCQDVRNVLLKMNKNNTISRIKPLLLIQRVVLLNLNLMALLIRLQLKLLFFRNYFISFLLF